MTDQPTPRAPERRGVCKQRRNEPHAPHECIDGWCLGVPEPSAPDDPLAEAIKDVCWRAQPYGEDQDGFIQFYLLTSGSLHRLIGAAQGAGIPAAFRGPSQPPTAPDDLQREIAEIIHRQVCPPKTNDALDAGTCHPAAAVVMDVLRRRGVIR